MIKFFKENKYPKDADVHALAEELEMDEDSLEEEIYAILTDFLGSGEWVKDGQELELDEGELKKGIEVEMEHTDCPLIAERIAQDHLTEVYPAPYYTWLLAMEELIEEDLEKEK